jgi:hypothetical protein
VGGAYYESEFPSFELPLKDEKNRTTVFQLAIKIIIKVQERVNESHTLNNNIKYCLRSINPSSDCLQLINWVDVEVPKFVQEARQHLALAQSPADIMSWLSLPRIKLNESLSLWSVYKEEDWDSLTGTEKRIAQKHLQNYIDKSVRSAEKKSADGEISADEKLRVSFLTVLYLRYQHFLKYKSMLGSLNLMQYLKSPNPGRSEIIGAIDQLESNLKNEESLLNQQALLLIQGQEVNIFYKSLLEVFAYSSFVEEVLLEYPQFCPIAARILEYRDNRALATSLGVGVPILVGSFFAPPLVGLAIGVVSGVGFTVEQQYDLNQEKYRNFDSIYGDDLSRGLDEISEIKRMRDLGLILMPISLGGGSTITSKLTALKLSAYLSTKSITTKDFFVQRIISFSSRIKSLIKINLVKK